MKFSSKMDNLVLLIFVLTLLVFPVFVIALIHILMLRYTVGKDRVKIEGLFKSFDIKYEDIKNVEIKNFENSVLSENIDLIATALCNKGVLITYLSEGKEKSVYISPETPQRFIDEVNKHLHKEEPKEKKTEEKELVIPEIVE
ncbi:MAG TPA: PH domain-containing protein [Acholeplasmataceae bacterium]|jgi:hypothetical protein|nr:hypothetical protein [Acholeplasmataceae bacterium]HPX71455.1 PH domain-containing protein [Acholeplasmataceae bacterium]HQC30490.1 PH domain-containing protein [Acholeplasmataceae bacterium]